MKIKLLLSILLYVSCIGSDRINFLHLALLAILKSKTTPAAGLEQTVTKTLKETDHEQASPELFKDLIRSVARMSPSIAHHEKLLLNSFDRFDKVPGYRKTIWLMLEHHKRKTLLKGHMFEIEQAFHMSNHGHEIIGFNQIMQHGSLSREFDIITATHLVECKNSRFKSKKRKSKKQFEEQKSLSTLVVSEQRQSYTFLVASRSTIPPGWRSWLNAQQIKFEDTYSSQHLSVHKSCKESNKSLCSCLI